MSVSPTVDEPPILTMREAADMLRIGLATAYRLAERGTLPVVRVPGTSITRVRRTALDQLIARWEQGGRTGRGGNGLRAR